MNTIKFNNADDLVQYCIENNLLAGQVWVDSNSEGKGERTLLWFSINDSCELDTFIVNQNNINNVHYRDSTMWHEDYKGTFELVLPYTQFTKPEVYAVGDWVEVLGNAYTITYANGDSWGEEENTIKIIQVIDTYHGISYRLQCNGRHDVLPHYCVRKVENPPREMTQAQIEQELGYKVRIIE
jgi:hypothetical protein